MASEFRLDLGLNPNEEEIEDNSKENKQISKPIKEVLFNEEDEHKAKIENLYIQAKLGSITAQNFLLIELLESTLSLSYYYAKSLKGVVNISFKDLRDMVHISYKRLMEVNDVFVDCEKFFKLLYMQEVNGAIRTLKSQNLRRNEDYDELVNADNINPNYNKEEIFSGRELLDLIINDPRARLSEKEKFIVNMVAHSYSVQEISNELNVCYSVAHRKVSRTLRRCKEYIEKYHEDIIKFY